MGSNDSMTYPARHGSHVMITHHVILMPSRMRILLYSFEKFEAAIKLEVHHKLLPHPHPHAPMEESMSTADIPLGTSQSSSSMPSIDELLRQYKACSAWKLVSMPNLTALCHKHKCDKCSTYLEHLLIASRVGCCRRTFSYVIIRIRMLISWAFLPLLIYISELVTSLF